MHVIVDSSLPKIGFAKKCKKDASDIKEVTALIAILPLS